MCRSTAAPLMAVAGVAGTAIGVAIAVLREKADRRGIERDARKEAKRARAEREAELEPVDEPDETDAGSSGGGG